jgi:hypothetical protein
MKIIGTYKITYDCGTTQEKNLIDHNDFTTIIKPIKAEISDLESMANLAKKTDDKDLIKVCKSKIRELKRQLEETFGESWFTNKSPLFEASKTGKLELPYYGIRDCKLTHK